MLQFTGTDLSCGDVQASCNLQLLFFGRGQANANYITEITGFSHLLPSAV